MAKATTLGTKIRRDDRVFLVGTTGSGKTSLVKALLWNNRNVVVLDPKRTFTWNKEHELTTDFDRVVTHDFEVPLVYRPSLDMLDDMAEPFFNWAFDEGDLIVYVDEVQRVTTPHKIGRGYASCIQLGRERNVSVWSATQRPANIPQIIATESEHHFIFRLRHPNDRKKMGEFTDPQVTEKNPEGNGFWYYNDHTQALKYYKKADLGKAR